MIIATRPNILKIKTLKYCRIALESLVSQTEIATIMTEFRYDSALIEEGKNIFVKLMMIMLEKAIRHHKLTTISL